MGIMFREHINALNMHTNYSSKLAVKKYIAGDIMEQRSPETAMFLKRLMDSFYTAIDESSNMLPYF